MEEQGKSVFREDGWLPTIFILKAHQLFSDGFRIRGLILRPAPASLTVSSGAGGAEHSGPSCAEWESKCSQFLR